MNRATNKFKTLYDTYSPMLYGIALQIAPTHMEAEYILSATFSKALQQNWCEQKHPSPCIEIIKLLIKTAHQRLNNNIGETNFKIKQFENTPMLHQLLCEQMTVEDYCMQNKIAKEKALKDFRMELSLILEAKIETKIPFNDLKHETYHFSKPSTK